MTPTPEMIAMAERIADDLAGPECLSAVCHGICQRAALTAIIEAQRPLLEALEKDLHILQYCPDKQKKAEALIAAAIKQAKGE